MKKIGQGFFLPESLPLYLFLLLHFPAFFLLLLLSETEVEELITDSGSKGKRRRRKEETPTQKKAKEEEGFLPLLQRRVRSFVAGGKRRKG